MIQLVTGIIAIFQAGSLFYIGKQIGNLFIVSHWVPALAFSAGLDTITTGMIAGRLIYHHRMQVKLDCTHANPYAPLVVIFIESAALSLISKILQLSIPSIIMIENPLVIPLCVSNENTIHVIHIRSNAYI
jgi:hypothetical protein